MSMHVERDPRFAEAQRRLDDFKLKGAKIQERITKNTEDIARMGKGIIGKVMSGGVAATRQLTEIRRDLAEAKEEAKIFKSVTHQAETALDEIRQKVTKRFSIENSGLLADAVDDFSTVLEPMVNKMEALRQACELPYLSNREWGVPLGGLLQNLRALDNIVAALRDQQVLMRKSVTEIESL